MSAITTTEDIVQNADYHNKLLREHSDLQYTPSALEQHHNYIQDLEAQLSASDAKLQELAKLTKKERKEHERLRDSTARKFAARISGKKEKFEADQMKEEKEYVEALHNEMVERDNNAMLQQLLSEACSVAEDLERKGKRHETVQKEIESLYSRVFDGPSESFPEEDKLEYDVHEAHKAHERAQANLNVESQAAELLARAVTHMDRCYANVKEALSYSTYDMFGGGRMADMMERNALTNATAQGRLSENCVDQARRINPVVNPVGHVNIAAGSFMSDVFFDNIFTDMAFHEKIKKSATQVVLANNRLKQERDAALRRADVAGKHLVQASQRLDDLRKELFYLRKALFESVASSAPRPPSYENVTNPPALSTENAGDAPSYHSASMVPAVPSADISSPGLYAPPTDTPPGLAANALGHSSGAYLPSSSSHPTFQPGKQGPAFPIPIGAAGPSSSTHGGASPEAALGRLVESSSDSPRAWGTRNPYAALLTERSRSMSESDQH